NLLDSQLLNHIRHRVNRHTAKDFADDAFIDIKCGTDAHIVAYRLTEAGVRGIMNFTPIRLSVPENVRVQNVDLTNELQTLIYFLDNDIG
ncbi:MAG: redox-sensing transcriptional repressor Rex, partial [Trichococcus flocculiformis]